MSVQLRIGNAAINTEYAEYEYRERKPLRIRVPLLNRDEAPAFANSGQSRHSNEIDFSGAMLEGWIDAADLRAFFWNEQSGLLMGEYPGVHSFVREDVEDVERAVVAFREKHKNALPQFDATEDDSNLARLMWCAWSKHVLTMVDAMGAGEL
ncbi:MAG: hypothetical protein EOP06_31485 [Proteobacteria bacterium]|nr:MAG: hypothetical protein EOP06_31485 [Pseudomonadota bacterium]